MKTLLKKIFFVLKKYKKNLVLILCLTIVFFIFRFPLSEFLEKNIKSFQKQNFLSFDFDDLKFNLFPPRLFLKNISFVYQEKRNQLDSLFISLSWKDLLAFKRTVKVNLVHEDSRLSLLFRRKKIVEDENKEKIFFINSSSNSIDLKDLDFLYPNMSGKVKGDFSWKGSLQDTESIVSELYLTGQTIKILKLQLDTFLGPLNLPPINWTKIELNFQIKEGELIFKKVELGTSEDALNIKMKGSSSFSYYRRLKIDSYNIALQIDLDKNLNFNFLNIMFSAYKEDKGSFDRYKVRLIGQGSQVPKMEKIESFK
ncbi:MAG: hypothetical protein GDA46_05680 [Bdellovibrionales bacterium]|nr:hypothetical protein [Bdellovibrionales bacterium]